jgi:hypothetical protein
MCRILRILYFLFLKIYSRPCTKKIVKQDYLKVVLRVWLNKQKRKCRILRILYFLFLKIYSRPYTKKIVKQDYLKVVLRGWLNKQNKIRSLLRILFFFYASKCSNQSLWHFAA